VKAVILGEHVIIDSIASVLSFRQRLSEEMIKHSTMLHFTKVNRFLQGCIIAIILRRLEKTLYLIANLWQRLSDLLGSRVHLLWPNETQGQPPLDRASSFIIHPSSFQHAGQRFAASLG
jgi:hypothetical protein